MPLIILLMLNLKSTSIILGLLLSFVTTPAMSAPLDEKDLILDEPSVTNNKSLNNGPTLARVISPKAIVYADENMNSPLGYIANGKVITVGNPRRLNRELVPVVVYGRVAFVEIKNLQYENASMDEESGRHGAPREHNFDINLMKPEEKLAENNSVYLSLHRFGAGAEIKQAFLDIEGEEKDSFTGASAQFIHRHSLSRFFWGVNFDTSKISQEQMELGVFFMGPTLGYTLLKNVVFALDVYASLDISVGTEFEIKNNFEKESDPVIWGPQVNARVVLFPEAKYHVAGGMGFRRYSVAKMAPLKDVNGNDVKGVKNITGLNLFLSFGIEFR